MDARPFAAGAHPSSRAVEIALIGNPNTGKSTLFNRLTGMRQRVGNYPGVTVERRSGAMTLDHRTVTVIDLPGAYSLVADSLDERVAMDVLAGRMDGTAAPDVVVCVVDATNLKRNLFLASQLAELGLPLVIALNMVDAAEKEGLVIDATMLSQRLGVPVVPTIAATGVGIAELKQAMLAALRDQSKMVTLQLPEPVQQEAQRLRQVVAQAAGIELADVELRRLLLDEDPHVIDRLGEHASTVLTSVAEARHRLDRQGVCPTSTMPMLRYDHVDRLLDGVIRKEPPRRPNPTNAIDRIMTHRVFGVVIFVAMMAIVFQSIYTWASPAMDAIEAGKVWVQDLVGGWIGGAPILQSLIVDGIIEGVGAAVIFLPQILILFFFISLLEDTGYMARAAFLMDKLFSWCGLSGKCFLPLLSSFACAVPGVMGARTIGDPRARFTTMMVAPLMSCSARLPVYVLLIGAFIEPVYGPFIAGLVLFAMHFVGLAVALPVAFVLNRFILKTRPQPFVLEMPPYRMPKARDVLWRMWERGREFLVRAGTVIFAMTIIIWALLYFPHGEQVSIAATQQFTQRVATERAVTADEAAALIESDDALAAQLEREIDGAYIEQSYMGRMGKAVQPVFAPAGFDWRITVGVLSSFPARETIIATLGIVYHLGGDVDEESTGLRDAIAKSTWTEGPLAGQRVFTPLVAVGLMVFFALCSQCGSTLAIIAKETSWKWATFTFIYMTVLAWIGAVAVYQIGSLFA